MRKKKIFSLLLAGALIGQTFSMGALTASAEENPLVGKEQYLITTRQHRKKMMWCQMQISMSTKSRN